MGFDGHGLCHLCQIGLIAIGIDYLPVSTFSFDVKLPGTLITRHTHPRYVINEHVMFIPMYRSENSWRASLIPQFGVSSVIFRAGEDGYLSDSDFLWFSQGAGTNWVVFGN